MMIKAVPVLPAINIPETILFYRDKLNFKVTVFAEYLMVQNAALEIHYFKTSNNYLCQHNSCFVWVNNVEDLYLQMAALDIIHPAGRLQLKTWGVKEFTIMDNNGNLLRFGQR